MSGPSANSRRPRPVAVALTVAAAAGLLAAGWVGASALAAGEVVAQTGTTETTTTTTEETTTSTTETTTEQTATQSPPLTIIRTQTTVTVTTAPLTVPATTSTTGGSSSTPWGWIVAGIVLAAAVVIGIVLWLRSRSSERSWSARADDLGLRTLVALDDVLAHGSVVTGRVQALAAEARSLETRAPDDRARARVGRLRTGLDGLVSALESDRSLRLASPPPSGDQLSYSSAVIRQHVDQLQGLLGPPPGTPGPP